jgi:hypothetical protein
MYWKKKNNYERTIPELLKKRKNEQLVGITYAVLSVMFFIIGIYSYFTKGILGPLIIFSTLTIIEFLVVLDCGITIQNINLLIYLKEHEK